MLWVVDAWMDEPGARVEGHRCVARSERGGPWRVVCSCGHRSAEHRSMDTASLALVRHLQAAVRAGAAVVPGEGDEDGPSGVREPRRPGPPASPGGVSVDLG